MIQKIYFPRLILPLSQAFVGLIDFAITFILLIAAMFWYGITPSAHIWYLPFFLLMAIVLYITRDSAMGCLLGKP